MKIKKENIYRVSEKEFNDFSVNFIKEKLNSFSSNEKINVALSGGSTPLPILKLLREEKLDWKKYNFFLVDERVVSVESLESNFKNIDEVFYQFISSNTFPMLKKKSTVDEMIIDYEIKMRSFLPISKNGFPKFDMIILGMGKDGHTASLFPKTSALNENDAIVVKNEIPHLNSTRITLTFPVITTCDLLIILLKGSGKIKVFNELNAGLGYEYPISRFLESNANWIISE